MSKKSWLGGSNDDTESKDGDKSNPSSAGTQDPGLQGASSDAAAVRPTNILRDDRSPETDDGEVNPHNEAMAQRPVAEPLDRQGEGNERLRKPKTDKDRADALKEWGRKARARGNVMSADWEEFQELTGERTPPPSQEDIRAAEQRQQQRATSDQAESTARKPQRA